MSGEAQARVDALVDDYRRSRERLLSTARELAGLTETVRSKDNTVTVTVGRGGVLSKLEIAPEAYHRYTPEQLGEVIVRTTEVAAARAAQRSGEVLRPALPPGMEPAAVLYGTGELHEEELTRLADAPAARAAAVHSPREDEDDDEESMEHRSWLDSGSYR